MSFIDKTIVNVIKILEKKAVDTSITIDALTDEYENTFGTEHALRNRLTDFRRSMFMTGQAVYVGQDSRISLTESFLNLLSNLTDDQKLSLIRCGIRLFKTLNKRENAVHDSLLNSLLAKGDTNIQVFHDRITAYVEETRQPPKQKKAAKTTATKQMGKLGWDDFEENIQTAARKRYVKELSEDEAIDMAFNCLKQNLT